MLNIENDVPMIERGIPIPARKKSLGAKQKYPFRQMKVGDSFFVPNKLVQRFYPTIRYAEQSIAKATGAKVRFHIAKWKNGSVEGVRCWREK